MESQNIHLDLKTQHETFVSGQNGSDVLEISIVASTAPLSLLYFKVISLFLVCNKTRFIKKFLLEYVILVASVLASLTVLADHSVDFLVAVALLCLSGVFLLAKERSARPIEVIGDDKTVDDDNGNLRRLTSDRPGFLTDYRAYVNLATSVCILAVDFPLFPRRFCKTETFGTGLMDVGVGSFVVANGVVSREARGVHEGRRTGFENLPRAVVGTWPLLALGLSRIAALKSVDYHEHVTEYGVHWNFFFTLAFVKISSSILFAIFSPKHSLLLALFFSVSYECLLIQGGLSDYLLAEGNRSGLLHANREGLWSCLGYLGLYAASVRLGTFLQTCKRSKHARHSGTYANLIATCVELSVVTVALWATLAYYQRNCSPVSRRMANLAYVVWMMAYNCQMILSFLVADVIVSYVCDVTEREGSNSTPSLLEAINDNGLTFFLASNLLTGLVNVSMDTVGAGDATAFVVLATYLLVLCVVVQVLHRYDLKIKFW